MLGTYMFCFEFVAWNPQMISIRSVFSSSISAKITENLRRTTMLLIYFIISPFYSHDITNIRILVSHAASCCRGRLAPMAAASKTPSERCWKLRQNSEPLIPGLVNIQKTMERSTMLSMGKSTINGHFQWVNKLFLWPCSIAMLT